MQVLASRSWVQKCSHRQFLIASFVAVRYNSAAGTCLRMLAFAAVADILGSAALSIKGSAALHTGLCFLSVSRSQQHYTKSFDSLVIQGGSARALTACTKPRAHSDQRLLKAYAPLCEDQVSKSWCPCRKTWMKKNALRASSWQDLCLRLWQSLNRIRTALLQVCSPCGFILSDMLQL